MQKGKTYFDQIPVKVVKKIADLHARMPDSGSAASSADLSHTAIESHRRNHSSTGAASESQKAGLQMGTLYGSEPQAFFQYPDWQKPYHQALTQLDDSKLLGSVAAAEGAISERLLAISHDPQHRAERQAIEDALVSLRILKRESDRYRQ